MNEMTDKNLLTFLTFLIICTLVTLIFLSDEKDYKPEEPKDTITLDDPDTLEISDYPHKFQQ